ncbi:c-type cytochrome [Niastella caeni]|uniref:C-type cytochrome n=1 Tax=Niastella caeni TaxID=2569763 RepID=A0A4S8HMR5_9BACT|nr:di-heme oxidoredictase family protein [Niastella caeni]THU36011.1 c-type cytochrome [Niastella caeni]
MAKKWMVISSLITIILIALACEKILPKAPADDEILDGPIEGLTGEQHQMFIRGDIAFNDDVFTAATGLGPLFVSTSCGSCHAGDGKGHPFTTLTRFGQVDSTGNHFLHLGGPQLQNRAVPSFMPEQLPVGATSSKFTPPANTGLGFLDAVSDNTILSMADEHDADGDGISGRVNWITLPEYISYRSGTVEQNNKYIGRFGKKAAVYDLMQQTANAYNQDMGIVSTYEPYDSYTHEEIDPEVSNQKVLDLVFYLRTLKAPVQRSQNDPEVISGKQLFTTIGCARCHTPELKTGPYSITALANKTFNPYTDLLLHDMGSGLNDGYTEGSALPEEWRTPPLWGLGLSKNSQGGQYFLLHDGRATSIEQAITLHGGEGQASNSNFQKLSATDKALLIKFLESL